MDENRASITAMVTAYSRAYHAAHDTPKIFDDFLAGKLFTEAELAFFAHNAAELLKFTDPAGAAACPDEAAALALVMRSQTAPTTLSRSRYTEDTLEAAIGEGVRQYVILGAGLDTFAFRRPELLGSLEVFEVDHPATQAFKRQRLAELGWVIPAQLHFVTVDFASESLETALGRSAYDPDRLSFFSWLGVTQYLTRDEVFATLRSLTACTQSGSTVVFDYQDSDALDPRKADKGVQLGREVARRAGEPMKAVFDPPALAVDLAAVGLRLVENLSPAEIEERYFRGRSDGYHALAHTHIARAVVG